MIFCMFVDLYVLNLLKGLARKGGNFLATLSRLFCIVHIL